MSETMARLARLAPGEPLRKDGSSTDSLPPESRSVKERELRKHVSLTDRRRMHRSLTRECAAFEQIAGGEA